MPQTQSVMHRLLLAFLFLFVGVGPAPIWAQTGAIQGVVIDGRSEEGLAGANVRLQDTFLGVSTGQGGTFTISGVPTGRYTLVATYVGFTRVEKEVRVMADSTETVAITLQPATGRLDEVQVIARQAQFQTSYETSKTIARLSPEQVESFNSVNAYDALRLVPGMNYLHGAGGRYGSPSRIRGGSAWTIPTVVDDFPSIRQSGIGAEDGGLKAGLGATIPTIALEGIEVKKGNSGVLYSGGANGGIIVNRLKRGQPGAPSGTLWFEANPISERLYMADIGGGTRTFDYYVATKLFTGDYQDMRDTQGRSVGDDNFFSGLVKMGYHPRSDMRLEVTGLSGRDQIQYEIPRPDDESTPAVDESQTLPDQQFETTNTTYFVGATLDHNLGEHASYDVGYSLFHDWALRYSVTDDEAHRDRPQTSHSAFANLHLNYALAEGLDYHGKAGAEVIRHRQAEHAGGSDKSHRFSDRSLFYANSFSFQDRLFLNGGVRYLNASDDFRTHNLWTYDLGAAYRLPVVRTKLRTSYSTGYSRNKGFVFFFGPIEEAGGVKISQSRSLEAGIDQPFSIGGRGEGSISATLFRRHDELVPVFSGWGAGTVYYEDREAQGIEVQAEYDLRAVSLLGSFAYTDTEIQSTTHPDGIGVGNTSVPVPRYTAGAGVQVQPMPKLRFTMLGTYDDGMRSQQIDPQSNDVTITTHSAYTRINLATSYAITSRLSARLRVENLLDETDLGYSTETFGAGGYSSTASTAERPGRFVSLAVTYSY